MPRYDNPYVYAVAAIALLVATAVVDDAGVRTVLVVLALGASVACAWSWMRQRRDPNGPAGQH